MLDSVDYLKHLCNETKEELHYRLTLENFDNQAKVITEGDECHEILIVLNGQIEIFVGDG